MTTTNKLTLEFTKRIENLTAASISVVSGGVEIGALSKAISIDGGRTFCYTLEIKYVPYPEGRHTVEIKVNAPVGYRIQGEQTRQVTVYKQRRR